MKKGILSIIATCLAVFLFSCAQQPPAPEWLVSANAVYPQSKYLCRVGDGASKEAAAADALAQLSRYISTSVKTQVVAKTEAVSESGSKSEVNRRLKQTSTIDSQFEFSELNYTEYYKSAKVWYVAVYIEREKAWEQYRPKVATASDEFFAIYDHAAECDPFRAYIWYSNAVQEADTLRSRLSVADTICSPLTENAFSKEYAALKKLPALTAQSLAGCTVYVSAKGDEGGLVEAAVSDSLKEAGFSVARTASACAYRADVTVEMNETKEGESGEAPIYVGKPSAIIELNYYGTNLYTCFVDSAEKSLAFSQKKMQRDSLGKISAKIRETLPGDLKNTLNKKL